MPLTGFYVAALLYGIVSLLVIPAMVAAAGPVSWGRIALGQAVGSVGAVLIMYGWNRSGPAKIARASAAVRRQEYLDSLRVGFALVGPVAIAAMAIASALVTDGRYYAAAGAAVATLTGFSGVWYFVGISRSYAYLFLEVMPRVLITAIGIALMNSGFSVVFGLASLGAGPLISLAIVTVWVFRSTASSTAVPAPKRKLSEVLAVERAGVLSSLGAAAYVAVPIGIVSVVSPASQPTFALVDRLFRQFLAAVRPVISMIQGWIPQAQDELARIARGRAAVAATIGFTAVLGIGVGVFGDKLLNWLGGGQISVSYPAIVLTGVLIALNTLDGVLGNAVLAAAGQLELAVRATYASVIVGLPAVAVGAIYLGAAGAIGGIIIGLALRITIELVGYALYVRAAKATSVGA